MLRRYMQSIITAPILHIRCFKINMLEQLHYDVHVTVGNRYVKRSFLQIILRDNQITLNLGTCNLGSNNIMGP